MLYGCSAGADSATATPAEKAAQARSLSVRTLFCTLSRPVLESYLQLRHRQRLLDLSNTYLRTVSRLTAWQYVAADTEAEDLELHRKLRQLKVAAAKAAGRDRAALQEARHALESQLNEAAAGSGSIKLLDGLDWPQLQREWAAENDPVTCPDLSTAVLAADRSVGDPDHDREEIVALVERIARLASERDRLQRRFSARDPVLWKLFNVEVNIYLKARPLAEARYRLLLDRLDRARGADSPLPMVATQLLASVSPEDRHDGPSVPTTGRTESRESKQSQGLGASGVLATWKRVPGSNATTASAPMTDGVDRPIPKGTETLTTASQTHGDAGKIVSLVYDWAGAWASRDLDRYLAFYSPDFSAADGTSRDAWEKARRRVIGHARNIHIELDDIDIQIEGDRATATFTQRYRATGYRDTDRKVLRFRRQGGRWLIVAESNR